MTEYISLKSSDIVSEKRLPVWTWISEEKGTYWNYYLSHLKYMALTTSAFSISHFKYELELFLSQKIWECFLKLEKAERNEINDHLIFIEGGDYFLCSDF